MDKEAFGGSGAHEDAGEGVHVWTLLGAGHFEVFRKRRDVLGSGYCVKCFGRCSE